MDAIPQSLAVYSTPGEGRRKHYELSGAGGKRGGGREG